MYSVHLPTSFGRLVTAPSIARRSRGKIAAAAKSVSEQTYLLQEVGSCDAAPCGDALAITLRDDAQHREFVTTEQPSDARASQWLLRQSSNEPVFAPRGSDRLTLEPKLSTIATTKARLSSRPIGGLTKRVLDIAVASVALVLLAPLLLLVALLIRQTMGGPVIFSHARLGYGGRPFACLKFRTMVNDADQLKDELGHLNEAASPMFKISDDPRVTRVGRLLRRTSLDEMPQLINVLRGEMSLVGPRPLVPSEDDHVIGYHRERLDLTPGLTGTWQVLGGNTIPFHEMIKLDYLYVAEWSLWNDVKLLIRTAPLVLQARGY